MKQNGHLGASYDFYRHVKLSVKHIFRTLVCYCTKHANSTFNRRVRYRRLEACGQQEYALAQKNGRFLGSGFELCLINRKVKLGPRSYLTLHPRTHPGTRARAAGCLEQMRFNRMQHNGIQQHYRAHYHRDCLLQTLVSSSCRLRYSSFSDKLSSTMYSMRSISTITPASVSGARRGKCKSAALPLRATEVQRDALNGRAKYKTVTVRSCSV
jgi:hypothetical protein